MKKIFIIIMALLFLGAMDATPCRAGRLYTYYLQLAHEALDEKQYDDALYYFDVAHSVAPDKKEPLQYINLIKRLEEDRIDKVEVAIPRRTIVTAERKVIKTGQKKYPIQRKAEYLDQKSSISPTYSSTKQKIITPLPNRKSQRSTKMRDSQSMTITADVYREEQDSAPGSKMKTIDYEMIEQKFQKPVKESKYDLKEIQSLEQEVIRSIRSKVEEEPKRKERSKSTSVQTKKVILQETVELDEELWQLQPKTEIEIELEKFVVLSGRNVQRFLMLNPDLFKVERVDQNTVKITPLRIGTSLFHLWEGKGRWTFNIRSIFPLKFKIAESKRREDAKEQYEDPFTISYSNNWGSTYRGDSMSNLERTSLRFTHKLTLEGKTPYGNMDAFFGFVTFDGETDLVRQGLGLSEGKIGPFKDFSIRGWDISKGFSKLSLPGRSFRGALLESYAFDRKIHYTLLKGHDRARFEVISPGSSAIKKSYIEAARLTYIPKKDQEFSVNYARGWGVERPNYLKDKVITLEAKNKIKDVYLHSELGYDEESVAKLVSASYDKEDYSLRLNVRDIDKDYKNISSRPAGTGEVGGELRFAWKKDKTRLDSVVEIYRDRELYNVDNKHGVNFNFSASLYKPLFEEVVWNSSFYYNDTSQLVSPQTSFRFTNRISKSFNVFKNHPFSIFMGHSYSQKRYDLSESSEYNRNELRAGLNVRIIRNLNYYLNYSYGWVKDIVNEDIATPRVMDMGLNYSRGITRKLSGRVNVSYRNEENTEEKFSFLSGTDSMRGSLGLTYRPYKDIEIFLDASVRNVWAERASQNAYNEADIRMGMRSSFDTAFRWSPSCIVTGTVYRDLNANKIQDADEPLLEGIRVQVGKKTVETNQWGKYKTKIRAKRARVSVDPQSIPPGFVFSTDAIKTINIEQGTEEIINFGLTSHSGIYGVVYLDKNNNGRLDAQDYYVPGARIILDNQIDAYSSADGVFTFNNIEHGRHSLRLDVNSLPVEYLPLIKIKNEIVVAEGTTYTFNIPLKSK